MKTSCIAILSAALLILSSQAVAETLEVGPGKAFARIKDAYAKAVKGDSIVVYPKEGNLPYKKVALCVKKSNITFRAATPPVKISGEGFNYTGRGKTPRAIFQFDEGADNCRVEGFELFGAHNNDNIAAGVRINKANNITVTNCDIHDNDMGIMSNGDGTGQRGADQRIEYCRIHHNGSVSTAGFYHNLYLDGGSAVVSFCEIYKSINGHNVKSRAHFTLVQYCYVHDSSDREFDLVDSRETQRPRSDAVLIGNIIVKDPGCKGNEQVINFGKDIKYYRDGKLYLIHNTIVTPFSAPMLMLSSPKVRADLVGNFICDNGMGHGGQQIARAANSAGMKNITGEFNVFGRRFSGSEVSNLSGKNTFGWSGASSFADPKNNDYRPVHPLPRGWPAKLIFLPRPPAPVKYESGEPLAWQYRHPAGKEKRPPEKTLTVGAYGYRKE